MSNKSEILAATVDEMQLRLLTREYYAGKCSIMTETEMIHSS